jgi:excisionase family DNA binding protein
MVLVAGVPVIAELPPESVDALRSALAAPMPTPQPTSPLLASDEAADLLRCRRRRVYELVADGRLTRCGDGRRLLVRRDEVERLAGMVTEC